MFAVACTIELFADRMPDFRAALMSNARAARAEPACRRFDVLTDPARPDEVFLYELYDDAAGFEAHKRTPHYETFDEVARDMIRRKSVTTYTLVDA